MITLAEALEQYPAALSALAMDRCRLDEALGRVLAEPAVAAVDLPLFTQSAVDGFALRSIDTAGATRISPVTLDLVGEIAAGDSPDRPISPGTAVRIFTGGALPEGADTSVRQEIVERAGGSILLRQRVTAGTDTRYRGEELRRGDVVAGAGQRLTSGLLAALAMAGVATVRIRRPPRVTVLITGNELAQAGTQPAASEIYDANGPLVRAWFVERGYPEPTLHHVRDEPQETARVLASALAESDLVLSTGGVSVGDHDLVPELALRLGIRRIFWQVAQKPGKPLWFGIKDRAAFLGIPGNPAAVLACLTVHVACALAALEGAAPPLLRWRTGTLEDSVPADAQRDRLVRTRRAYGNDGCLRLSVLPRQESHMLSNLGAAEALAWLPARPAPYEKGECVHWLPLTHG